MSTWWMDCKNIKKKFFSRWLFEIIHIIRFEIWDLRSRDLKIFLGYDINYLSIWPFMCHPWFPTRKASKLTFICFQLQLSSPCNVFNTWCWKQINVSFEAFLVGNQGLMYHFRMGHEKSQAFWRVTRESVDTRYIVDWVWQWANKLPPHFPWPNRGA